MPSLENEKFHSFFSQRYGERWETLWKSLLADEKQVRRRNPFSDAAWDSSRDIKWLPGCQWQTPDSSSPQRSESGLLDVYIMDPASVLVARALEVQSGDRVLDMCAAPGGKSLVLAENLVKSGELIANETSDPRRDRLMQVIRQYLPEKVRSRVWVKGIDGLQYGMREPTGYDRVLVDAPCSGERHLAENPKEFSYWSEKRTKSLAQKQYSLLTSAILAVKPLGRIVYSTCSLSPYENDEVIARLLKKKGDQVAVIQTSSPSPFAEQTEFGWVHLPDKSDFGPLYYSVLNRK